jgi:WhiB family redox-sensing transcriptional regulator
MNKDWRSEAACRNEDPESFFILEHNAAANLRRAERMAICWRCPVRQWCLLTAIRRRDRWGVFGGYDMEVLNNHSDKRDAAKSEATVELWFAGVSLDEVESVLS